MGPHLHWKSLQLYENRGAAENRTQSSFKTQNGLKPRPRNGSLVPQSGPCPVLDKYPHSGEAVVGRLGHLVTLYLSTSGLPARGNSEDFNL